MTLFCILNMFYLNWYYNLLGRSYYYYSHVTEETICPSYSSAVLERTQNYRPWEHIILINDICFNLFLKAIIKTEIASIQEWNFSFAFIFKYQLLSLKTNDICLIWDTYIYVMIFYLKYAYNSFRLKGLTEFLS